jgi:hypothetical protein
VRLARFIKPKAVFSHMQNIDLIQIQQYYEKQVTLRRVTYKKGRVKGGN